jgi:hypothetical protein
VEIPKAPLKTLPCRAISIKPHFGWAIANHIRYTNPDDGFRDTHPNGFSVRHGDADPH